MGVIIDLFEIIDLKQILTEKFGVELHIHDACGGQYFSVDGLTPDAKTYIIDYFRQKEYGVIFNSEDKEFYLEEQSLC